MDKVDDIQAWLKEELNGIVKLYLAGQREEAFEAFSAVVGKGRFQNLVQEEKEAAFLKPLKVFAAQWEEKEGLVIAGRIRAWMNDFLSAKQKFELAIALDADYALGYNFRGVAHSELGEKQKALLDFDKAIALDPESAAAYNNRGNVRSDLGDKQKALQNYDKAIALDPEYAAAYNNRGNAHSNLGDKQKALQDYNKAIALDSEYANAYYNRSLLFEEDANFNEAIQDLEKFLELDSDAFWIERAKGRLVSLKAKLKDKSLEEISGLIDKIREALRFEGDQISHFTSLVGARYMMLEKSPFRLSEASFMNDPSEGKALFDLHKLPESFNVNIGRKDGEYIKKPFFGCFVKAEMRDDLAMWRLYGHDAAGASITFDRGKLFSALMQNEKLKNLGPEALAGRTIFEFFQIAYFDEKGKVVLPGKTAAQKKALQGHLDELKKSLLAFKMDDKSKAFSHLIQEKVASIMYLFKSAQYQYEKEVRLMVSDVGFDVVINPKDFMPPRAYLEIAPIHQAVECITLGPKVPRSEEWVSAFYYFFEKEKLEVKLHVSHLPYK